jgi:hypothetical protein
MGILPAETAAHFISSLEIDMGELRMEMMTIEEGRMDGKTMNGPVVTMDSVKLIVMVTEKSHLRTYHHRRPMTPCLKPKLVLKPPKT